MSIVDRIKETVQGWFGGSGDKAASEARDQAASVQEAAEAAQDTAGAAVEETAESAADEASDEDESEEDTASSLGNTATAQADETTASTAEMSASAEAAIVDEASPSEAGAAVVEEAAETAAQQVSDLEETAEATSDAVGTAVAETVEAVEDDKPEMSAAPAAVATTDAPIIEPPDDEPITQVEVEPEVPASSGVGDNVEEIEGIGPAYRDRLAEAGIVTTGDLLDRCGDSQGREAVAEATGLASGQLLKWANMADLMRIKGVGGEFAELLEAAGVDTVKELRRRNAENLANAMQVTNEERKLTRRTPAVSQIQDWIDQANELEPMISH